MKKLLLLLAATTALFAQAPGPGAGVVRTMDGLPSVQWFPGCDPTGATASTTCFQNSINAFRAVRVPNGIWKVGPLTIPANTSIVCDRTAQINRTGTAPTNTGWIDVPDGTGVTIDGCFLDGQTTTSATQDRSSLPGALDASFTANSTLWVHGGSGFVLKNGTIQHSAGYPTILQATAANIDHLTIEGMTYRYNRSFLFGDPGNYNFGSYQGGILIYTDNAYGVTDSSIINNHFTQNTGHAIFFDAVNGNNLVNRNIIVSHNHFKTIGLDGIENSGISGITVEDDTFDGIGFVSILDTDLVGTARWYNGLAGNVPAVAVDTASLVVGATINGNTFRLINGGCVDGDGLGESTISHNHARNPMPADADYNGTIAGQMGPAVFGGITSAGENWASFYNAGNTNDTAQGAASLKILDNSIYGMGGGAIKLYAARGAMVSGNVITLPGDSNSTTDKNFSAPIMLGNKCKGSPCLPTANLLNNNVTVTLNKIMYSGSAAIAAMVVEDAQYAAYTSAQANYTYDNDIPPGYQPFQKDANSSSTYHGSNSTTASGVTSAGSDLTLTQSGSAQINTVRNHIELQSGTLLSRWYSGASPLATTNLMFTLGSNGAVYLGNGGTCTPFPACSTGSLWWGATQLISATQDAFFNSVSSGGSLAIDNVRNMYENSLTDVASASLVLDGSRNFRGNSVSVGTPSVANSAAGLAITNNRDAILRNVLVGTSPSALTVIDSVSVPGHINIGNINDLTAAGNGSFSGTFGVGGAFSVTGNSSLTGTLGVGGALTGASTAAFIGGLSAAAATIGSGASSFAGNLGIGGAFSVTGNSSLTGTLGVGGAFSTSGIATVGTNLQVGGTINATGLGSLSGSGSTICLDGSGFLRSSNCPGGGTLGANRWLQVDSGSAADVQTAVNTLCGLSTPGGTVEITKAITLSANITASSCSGSSALVRIVKKEGVVITDPGSAYTLFGVLPLATGEEHYTFDNASVSCAGDSLCNTGGSSFRPIDQPLYLVGRSDCNPAVEQIDAGVIIANCTSDSLGPNSVQGRNALGVFSIYNGTNGTAGGGISAQSKFFGVTDNKGAGSVEGLAQTYSGSTAGTPGHVGGFFGTWGGCMVGSAAGCSGLASEVNTTVPTAAILTGLNVNVLTGVGNLHSAFGIFEEFNYPNSVLTVNDLVTNGTTTGTSSTGGFNSSMVGMHVAIKGSQIYQIASVVSSNQITFTGAVGSASGQTAIVGVNTSTAFFVDNDNGHHLGGMVLRESGGFYDYFTAQFMTANSPNNIVQLVNSPAAGGCGNNRPNIIQFWHGEFNQSTLPMSDGPLANGVRMAELRSDLTTFGNCAEGYLDVYAGHSSVSTKIARFDANGLTVVGTAATPGITLTNGYMQSSEGYYSTSTLANALNIPNGGASVQTADIGTTAGTISQQFAIERQNFTNLQTYANSDHAIFNFYQAQNYPTTSAFGRVLDIMAGASGAGGYIRFLTQPGGSSALPVLTLDRSQNATFAQSVGIGAAPTTYALEVTGVSEATGGFYTGSGGSTAINAPIGTVASLNATFTNTLSNTIQTTGTGGGANINGTIRSQYNHPSSSGSGYEMDFDTGNNNGYLISINRSTGAYLPAHIDGSTIQLNQLNSGVHGPVVGMCGAPTTYGFENRCVGDANAGVIWATTGFLTPGSLVGAVALLTSQVVVGNGSGIGGTIIAEGNIQGTSYTIGDGLGGLLSTGLSCNSGINVTTFRSINGLVTHC